MMGRLAAAARGSKNVASSGADEALKRIPHSNNKGLGKMSAGNPAGYNASKSAYVQSNKSGYQARPRQNSLNPPRQTNLNLPRNPSTQKRISDFRKPDYSRLGL